MVQCSYKILDCLGLSFWKIRKENKHFKALRPEDLEMEQEGYKDMKFPRFDMLCIITDVPTGHKVKYIHSTAGDRWICAG